MIHKYWHMIHWAGLQNRFWICGLLCVVVLFLFFRVYRQIKTVKKLVAIRFQSLLLYQRSFFYKFLKNGFFFLGFLTLSLALLQPQWDKKEENVQQEGRDLLIAVDISRSMLGQDLKPNRLEFAKQKIKKLLFNLSCERVGLILFSGDAVVQCPLTKDYSAFFMFLDNLDVETISSGTTTIEGAISLALQTFESMPERQTKLLCIFTDGEDFSTNLAGIKEKAEREHLAIFAFGVGTKFGAPIPVLDSQGKQIGFEKDASGNIVMSKLNDGILKNLTVQTGGKYIPTTPLSHDDIKEFIAEVQKFEKDSLEDATVQRYQEQYPYFVAVSLICFILEWLL